MKIYLVLLQYCTDDCDGVDTQAFSTYKKAFERFNEIIENEKNTDMSWAGNAFENDKLQKNKYGYKVCYKQHGKRKLKIYLVTNSYDLAFWEVRWYETHSPPDSKTNIPITNATWLIIPVKNYIEYKLLWRGCPF